MPPNFDINRPIRGLDGRIFRYEEEGRQYIQVDPIAEIQDVIVNTVQEVNNTGQHIDWDRLLTVNNDINWAATEPGISFRVDDLQRQINELREHFMSVRVNAEDVNRNGDLLDAVRYAAGNPFIGADVDIEHTPTHIDRDTGLSVYADTPDVDPSSEEELFAFLSDCGVVKEAM